MSGKYSTVVTATLLAVTGVAAFIGFLSSGHPGLAATLGFIVPAGTAYEWRAARERSMAEGAVAERFAAIVTAALMFMAATAF